MSVDVEHVQPLVFPRDELAAFIAEQEGRIGDVYRLTQQAIGHELYVEELQADAELVGSLQEVP